MITQLRRKLKSRTARSIILWIILSTLTLGLLLTLVTKIFKLDFKKNDFVTVNGEDVSYSSFMMKYRENEQRMRLLKRYFGEESDKFLKEMGMIADPKILALDSVIDQELLNQLADRLNICLSSDFITQKMSDKMFLQQEFGLINFNEVIDPTVGFRPDVMRYYLKMLGLTISDFENLALRAMKKNLISNIALFSCYVPEFEVRQKYLGDNLDRKFSILKFDFESFFKKAKEAKVSKKDLKSFYDFQNKKFKRYWVPQKRSGELYAFDANSYGVKVEDEEIKQYYDDNKMKSFVDEPAKVQVRRILFQVNAEQDREGVVEKAKSVYADLILEPSKFVEIAKEVSDDKETAKEGGLLPIFSRGERNREFEKAAFLLKDDGDISEVITTDEGYEILQRAKRQEAKCKALSKVKSEIKNIILEKKFKMLFSADMNRISSKYSFDEDKFNDFIKKSIKKEKIDLHVASGDKKSQALFRIRGKIPAFYFDQDKGYVVTLENIKEKHLPALNEIEGTVENDYFEQEASENLDKFIKNVRNESQTKSFDQLQKLYKDSYKVGLDRTEWIRQDDQDKVSSLRSKGYPVEQIFKLEKVGFIDNFRENNLETADGYVVKVDQIEKLDDKDYAEKIPELKNELIKLKGMAQLEEFIAFLRRISTIKVYR